jgi:hypothetical protein
MIVNDRKQSPRPLLAPQFDRPGPYPPGATVPVTLPIRNERPTAETNLWVLFHGDGCTLDPKEVHIDKIAGREQQNIETTATILPTIEGRRQIRVWAELTGSTVGPVTTAEAHAPISVRTGITLSDDGNAILITNDGDLPTDITLQVEQPFLTTAITFADSHTSDPFTLQPNQQRHIPNDGYVGRIIAHANNGERAIIHRRTADKATPVLEVHLEIETSDNGARHQDLCPFILSITNAGNIAARETEMNLSLPEGVSVALDLLTIDDVRVLTEDRTLSPDLFNLQIGRLAPGATTIARGAFIVSAGTTNDDTTLTFEGFIKADNTQPTPLHRGISIDHAPLFVPHSTYIADPVEKDDGSLQLDVVITHSEARPISNAYLQLEVHGARISSVGNGTLGTYTLQPTTVANRNVMNVKLGRLDPDQRIIARIQLAPTPSNEQEHKIDIHAALLADGHNINLGTREYTIPGKADLRQSTLEQYGAGPLRLNMPSTIYLSLRNHGTVPAKDVRVAFELPHDVVIDMPTEPHGRWYPLVAALPPGGSAGMPITIHLIRPPTAPKLVITAAVDAENAHDFALEPIAVDTPSTPDIRATEPNTRALEHGMIAVATRISNEGDGTATGVVLLVPNTDHPMPRTTTVDGSLVAEDTTASVLIEGLDLGDLPPGTFREITWIVAPPAKSYRANITVTSTNSDHPKGIKRSSKPTTSHLRHGFATELPDARLLDDVTINQQPDAPHAHVPTNTEQTALRTDTPAHALPSRATDSGQPPQPTPRPTSHHNGVAALPEPIDVPLDTPASGPPAEPAHGFRSFTGAFERTSTESLEDDLDDDDDLHVVTPGEGAQAGGPPAGGVAGARGAVAAAASAAGVGAAQAAIVASDVLPAGEHGDPVCFEVSLPAEPPDEELAFMITAENPERPLLIGTIDLRDTPVVRARDDDTQVTRLVTLPIEDATIPIPPGTYTLHLEMKGLAGTAVRLTVLTAAPPRAPAAQTDLWGRNSNGQTPDPTPPPAPALAKTEPLLSGLVVRRLLDFAIELTDPELDTLNGWKHLIILRVLADPRLTDLSNMADACAEFILPSIMARTWTHATPAFTSALSTYDDGFRQALIASGFDVGGTQPGAVDAALTQALPVNIDHDDEQLRAAYTEYVLTLREHIGNPRISGLSKADREQMFTATQIKSADECLTRLASAVGDL